MKIARKGDNLYWKLYIPRCERMRKKFVIRTESIGEVEVELIEEISPETAQRIWNAMPFTGRANLWGDEIYFRIPVEMDEENGREVVELGDVAYWPPGNAMCIFFGKTPVSVGNEIRPASAVNIFGKILGDISLFKKVREGEIIEVRRM